MLSNFAWYLGIALTPLYASPWAAWPSWQLRKSASTQHWGTRKAGVLVSLMDAPGWEVIRSRGMRGRLSRGPQVGRVVYWFSCPYIPAVQYNSIIVSGCLIKSVLVDIGISCSTRAWAVIQIHATVTSC
ncbi:hypothetical protein EDB85DRAFT_216023 [Lactarius pseudohatsudake]|nr:hypothetical protein EDB85DRAFT_216023 [Lactarius pseudohatsudake]